MDSLASPINPVQGVFEAGIASTREGAGVD